MAHGILLRNADGKDVLNGRQTLPRLLRRIFISSTFNGTRGPYDDFDENRGLISIAPNSFRYNPDTGGRVGEGVGTGDKAIALCNQFSVPNIHWDNVTKILTITPATQYSGKQNSDWALYMIHYK